MTGLRERKKRETRQQLMYTAIRLYGERGFHQVTVEDIAAAANVSPSTFFRYFESKAGAVYGLAGVRLEAMRVALNERPADASALAVIRDYWRTQFADFQAAPDVYHAQQDLAERYGPVAAERSRVFDVGRIMAAEALREERPDRPLVETEMIASVLVSAVFTAMRVWHEQGGDPREALDACWRIVDKIAD